MHNPPTSFGDILRQSARTYPNKTAIVDGNRRISYQELNLLIQHLGKQWEKDIEQGMVVAIFLPNSLEYIATYFTVTTIGAILFPLYWSMSATEISHLLDFVQADIVISNQEGSLKLPPFINCLLVTSETLILSDHKEEEINYLKTNGEVAILLQTSGTTSAPKIVAHSYSTILTNVINHVSDLNLTSNDVVLITLPMPFGYCNTSQFLTHIYLGGTLIISDSFFHPKKLLKSIDENGVTVFTAVPTFLKAFETIDERTLGQYNLSTLRLICFGGGSLSKVSVNLIRQMFPHVTFIQTYGQTEAGPRITSKRLNDDYIVTNVGRPLPQTTIKVVNRQGDILKNGEIGEICVNSPSIMIGYFKDPNRTEKVKLNEYLYTGDYGFVDEHGELFLVGRKSTMFKSRGMQVNPEEIEEFIRDQFPVQQAVVRGIEHPFYGTIPEAIIVLSENIDDETLKYEISRRCRERFSSHKVPKSITIINNLPLTSTGKVKRIF